MGDEDVKLKDVENNSKVKRDSKEKTPNEQSSMNSFCSKKSHFVIPFVILIIILGIAVTVILLYLFVIRNDFDQPEARPFDKPWKTYRLPDNVIPIDYDLHMFPDMYDNVSNTFTGYEIINVRVVNSTYFVILNTYNINITSSTVWDSAANKELKILKTFTNADTQMFIIEMKYVLPKDIVLKLELSFSGIMQNDYTGFYKSYFVSSFDNETKYMATTKFEPASARKAFPCFDEPQLKAFYTVRLIHKKTFNALSNMPLFEKTKDHPMVSSDLYVVSNFKKTTVKMSTYLVAFIVFESYKSTTHGLPGRQIRVFAPSHKVNATLYAGMKGVLAREYLDQLLDFKSPLPKVDMISIPHFSSGAMENWGLITYRESTLLADDTDSDSRKYRVCRVVCHELAHTWFGNIVTMNWWNDIWLNEGFATYFASLAMKGSCSTNWNLEAIMFSKYRNGIMIQDGKSKAQPIKKNITDPRKLRKMFNMFVYSKGSALLAWIHSLMGNDNFISGIRSYIKDKQYSTAVTSDLWRHLGQRYSKIQEMNSFLVQSGMPYVTVNYYSENKSLSFEQSPFSWYIDETNNGSTERNKTWSIPIKYKTSQNSKEQVIWLPKEKSRIDLSTIDLLQGSKSWILINSDSTGYYRVKYDSKLFDKLIIAISETKDLTALQKSTLFDDVSSLAFSGNFPYSLALSSWKIALTEESTGIWKILNRHADYISNYLNNDGWNAYMKDTYSSAFSKWNKPSIDNFTLDAHSNLFIYIGCEYGNSECSQLMGDNFNRIIRNQELTVPDYTKLSIYHFGLRNADTQENWKLIINLLNDTSYKNVYFTMISIVESKSPARLQAFFDLVDTKGALRTFNLFGVAQICSRSRFCTYQLWLWLQKNCRGNSSLPDCDNYLFKNLKRIAKFFNSKADYDQLKAFIGQLPFKLPEDFVKKIFNRIENNIFWVESTGIDILVWLKSEGYYG